MNVDQVNDLAANYVGHTLVGCHLYCYSAIKADTHITETWSV